MIIFFSSLQMSPTNIQFSRSSSPGKKLKVQVTYQGKQHTLHFGATSYQHYYDRTGLLPKSHNHKDPVRRRAYFERHSKVLNKAGKRVISDPLSASYWACKYLW
jgi:hypothetical protein